MLLFDLTPAEAKIAALLAEGQSIITITDELSISESTAKTHLRRIFEKTGTSRQAELVSLLLRVGFVG
jgi:DNA-binding CsgD family transcriptional regulator